MLLPWQFVILGVSLGVLFVGAESLVRGSSSLALRLGLSPLVVGLTVVAFGTSAPEMVVSISATLKGQGDLAIGNAVGSNIFNIAVILGLTAMICPIRVTLPVLKLDAPIMLGVALLLAVLAWTGEVTRWMGGGLVIALVCYTAFNVVMSRRQPVGQAADTFATEVPLPTASLGRDLLLLAAGLAALVIGSQLLVKASVAIAQAFGLSEAVIGLTIVAAGTGMPELATSMVAALRKQPDIAVGNVIGSNTFNVLGVVGASALTGLSQLDPYKSFF